MPLRAIEGHREGDAAAQLAGVFRDWLVGRMTALLMLEAVEQTAEWRTEFLTVTETLEPVRDIYRLARTHDFMLRVVVADMPAIAAFQETLASSIRLLSVSSVFTLEQVKVSAALPL